MVTLGGVRVTLHQAEVARLTQSPEGDVFKAIQNTGRRVQNEARKRCPVDTGRLRQSIHATTYATGGHVVSRVSSPERYAIYVHEGTRYMRARPFLAEALEAVSLWPTRRY